MALSMASYLYKKIRHAMDLSFESTSLAVSHASTAPARTAITDWAPWKFPQAQSERPPIVLKAEPCKTFIDAYVLAGTSSQREVNLSETPACGA
jgi:hypothetical protein